MIRYLVFLFPVGGDREDAIKGEILCPCNEFFATSDESAKMAFPHAVRIYRFDLVAGGECIFKADK